MGGIKGGKSRKTGGISKALIDKIRNSKSDSLKTPTTPSKKEEPKKTKTGGLLDD